MINDQIYAKKTDFSNEAFIAFKANFDGFDLLAAPKAK
jgi:hypothetical protein